MNSFLNWSGGKDSAWCLQRCRAEGLPPSLLVTSVSQAEDRVSMHGLRRSLLEQQARSLGLPLHTVELPQLPSMTAYEDTIRRHNRLLVREGFSQALFGDLFLEDLKDYRQRLYALDGLECRFPIWGTDTRRLMEEFIGAGFRAIVICVDGRRLDPSFCGRLLDRRFLDDLPGDVDPCGENGEYHSFVFDGPGFRQPVAFEKGELVYREYPSPRETGDDCFLADPPPPSGFYFCDLL